MLPLSETNQRKSNLNRKNQAIRLPFKGARLQKSPHPKNLISKRQRIIKKRRLEMKVYDELVARD